MIYRTRVGIYHVEGIDNAGHKAGAFLDKIGKTDLATLTVDQWKEFVTTACDAYCASFAEHNYYMLEEEIPF